MSQNQQAMLQLIKVNPYITANKISIQIGISQRKVQLNISKLKAMNILKRVGPDKGGYWEISADNKKVNAI